jgi:hypothetical protein
VPELQIEIRGMLVLQIEIETQAIMSSRYFGVAFDFSMPRMQSSLSSLLDYFFIEKVRQFLLESKATRMQLIKEKQI